jgi:uncharacterized RDD family membrane protein YckC
VSTYGTAQPHDVVTGEAVALELRLAQLPSRALALMLDMLIQIVMLFLLYLLLAVGGGSLDDAAGAAVLLVVTIGVIVGYPLVFETLTRGKTVGKYALGLRAVRDDGGSIRFRHALVRALIEFVEIWLLLGVPALFCSLANSKGKRFGDLAAGTVVVRERAPVETGARAVMPPELAGWAAVADVGRVPDDLALAARQFLVRAPALDPNVRWSMSQRLASDIVPWLAPPPPQSSAERLLAAVVAERRRRDEHRMATQAAAARAWASTAVVPPTTPPGPPAPAAAPTSSYDPYGLRPAAPAPPPPDVRPADGFTAPH